MIITFLDYLKDPRRSQGQRYELKYVVLFSIMAILSNGKSYRDIHRYIDENFAQLIRDFELKWKKAPAYTTIRNIIILLNTQELEKCFREYTKLLSRMKSCEYEEGISIDGKVLRGSFDHFNDKKAIQVLSFFNTSNHLILAHKTIETKTNEIPEAQQLLNDNEIVEIFDNKIFTLDALHCQKKTFEVAQNADTKRKLIVQVKENQKFLLQDCKDVVRFSKGQGHNENIEKGRNRIEKRTVTVYKDDHDNIENRQWSEYIKVVIVVERETQLFDTKKKMHKSPRKDTSFYIANFSANATLSAKMIRDHWGIENKDHYVRDVTLKEDYSRIRIKAENFSILRSFTLNVLRFNDVTNIADETYRNSLNFNNLYNYQQFI